MGTHKTYGSLISIISKDIFPISYTISDNIELLMNNYRDTVKNYAFVTEELHLPTKLYTIGRTVSFPVKVYYLYF